MNEWMNEWMNERTTNEQTNKQAKKQSEQINVQITTWDKQTTVQKEKIDEKTNQTKSYKLMNK